MPIPSKANTAIPKNDKNEFVFINCTSDVWVSPENIQINPKAMTIINTSNIVISANIW